MRKVLIGLVAAVSMYGAVQAESESEYLSVGEYAAEQNLQGSDVDEMWAAAWRCFADTEKIMMGADFKAKGHSLDDVKKGMALGEDTLPLFEKGYRYEDPFDRGINKVHVNCLNEAHRKITTK